MEPINPNDTLSGLRDAINGGAYWEDIKTLFDDLDYHIQQGGELPVEWQTGN